MIATAALASLLGWLMQATIKGSLMVLLVVALNALIGRRIDARWRHLLWLIVLVRLALPAAPVSRWSLFNFFPADEHVARATRSVEIGGVAVSPGVSGEHASVVTVQSSPLLVFARWIAAVWLLGVALLTLRTMIATVRIRRAVAAALRGDVRNETLETVLAQCRQQLGIRRSVRIVECDAVRTPALHGVFRPVLLLPTALSGSFTMEELRYVVLHELWHLRRMDVAVSWALSAVQTLHWFNPLVWFAALRMKEERELACDELALSCLEEDERFGYGRTILKLLESFHTAAPVPALVGIVNGKQKMKRRLTMITSFRNRTRFSLLFLFVVAAVGAMALTDAKGGGDRHMLMKHADPAALPTIERMHKTVTLETSDASFADLLNTVATAGGVAVTQSPDLATLPVQQAKFTIKASNVPLHAVLMEALMPFQLMAEPSASGITIKKGDEHSMMLGHGAKLRHEESSESEDGGKRIVEKMVISSAAGEATASADDGATPHAGNIEHKVTIRATAGVNGGKFDENGKLHRELTLNMNENGTKSEGKLTIDITK